MSKKKINVHAIDLTTEYGDVRICEFEHMQYALWRGNLIAKSNISMGDEKIAEENINKFIKEFIVQNPEHDSPFIGTYAIVLSSRGELEDEIDFLSVALEDIFDATEEELSECIEEFKETGSIIIDYGFTTEVVITVLSLLEAGMDSSGIRLNTYYLPYEQMISEDVLMSNLVEDFELK